MDCREALSKADIVYPDGVAKGFPLWTEKGLKMQKKTLDAFLHTVWQDYDVGINYAEEIVDLAEFTNLYRCRLEKYGETLPTYTTKDNKERLLVTDVLPYNLRKMIEEKRDCLITYYYVIRLLNAKIIPMSRDYYISPLAQLNIHINTCSEEKAVEYVLKCCSNFLKLINLPSVALEYSGVDEYSTRVFMFASTNNKNELGTIIQCSLLSPELLSQFGLRREALSGYVFDIGYSQKLFAYLCDNNSDEYGFRLPSYYEQDTVVILYKDIYKDGMIEKLEKTFETSKAVVFNGSLGTAPLSRLAKDYLCCGCRNIFVQRIVGKETFLMNYFTNENIYDLDEIIAMIRNCAQKTDEYFYNAGMSRISSLTEGGYGRISEFGVDGKIVNIP